MLRGTDRITLCLDQKNMLKQIKLGEARVKGFLNFFELCSGFQGTNITRKVIPQYASIEFHRAASSKSRSKGGFLAGYF